MNKTSIRIMFGMISVAIVGYLYTSFIGMQEVTKPVEESREVQETELIEVNKEVEVADVADVAVEKEKLDSKLEKEFPMDSDEDHIQNAIHHMSHSKVYANQKWGHLEVTKERIDRLLDVVEENRNYYENSDLYISILKKWGEGDFSESVSAHNHIWELRGGNTGKATRLLSEEEEAEYKEEYFE